MRAACILTAGLWTASAFGAGPVDLREFRWRIPLKDSLETGALYRIPIPNAVHDGCFSFPADLRLVGENGADWPFFIQSPGPGAPLRDLRLTPLAAGGEAAPADGVQRVFFDAGHRFLPMRTLSLETDDGSFARAVKVFGRNHPTNQWRWMADGGIHRLPGQERLRIDLKNTRYRYLKIEVFNYDEPALAISGATAGVEAQFIVAQPAAAGRAHLYFGTPLHLLPRFELQHRTGPAALDAARAAEFGSRRRNVHRLLHEIWTYGRLLGAIFLGAAALFIAPALLKRRRAA